MVPKKIHELAVKIKQICENLKRRTSDKHFAHIVKTKEKYMEKEFTEEKKP